MKFPQTVDAYAELLQLMNVLPSTARKWAPILHETVVNGVFSQGPKDFASFLPQIVHESNKLEALTENLNYSSERIIELGMQSPAGSRWRSIVPRAKELARNPRKLANAIYSNRMGNGNEESGDGWRYRGRSPIQLTGANNYELVGNLMGQDLLSLPELMEQPRYALEGCIYWWEDRIPDSVLGDHIRERILVNGGKFGLADTTKLAGIATRFMG